MDTKKQRPRPCEGAATKAAQAWSSGDGDRMGAEERLRQPKEREEDKEEDPKNDMWAPYVSCSTLLNSALQPNKKHEINLTP